MTEYICLLINTLIEKNLYLSKGIETELRNIYMRLMTYKIVKY